MPKHSDRKPWERQNGESSKAIEAFNAYLEMGADRSLRAVGQKLGKSRVLMERWSSTYAWVERAAAYDAELRRQANAVAIKRAQKMAEKHIAMALRIQERGLAALKDTRPEDLDPKTILAFIREGTKMEREARSEIVRMTAPEGDTDATSSTFADEVVAAWEKRRDG